jgi:seryl-tRNA synthetase
VAGGSGAAEPKPQWKAAVDFKWIRDNRDAVAANIQNRSSAANLGLVLQLYDEYLALQKVRGFSVSYLPVVRVVSKPALW